MEMYVLKLQKHEVATRTNEVIASDVVSVGNEIENHIFAAEKITLLITHLITLYTSEIHTSEINKKENNLSENISNRKNSTPAGSHVNSNQQTHHVRDFKI